MGVMPAVVDLRPGRLHPCGRLVVAMMTCDVDLDADGGAVVGESGRRQGNQGERREQGKA